MSVKVAINGFGRIGRLAFRQMFEEKDFEIVAVNDLSKPSVLAYLLKYDSTQGRIVNFGEEDLITADDEAGTITVKGKTVKIYGERDARDLPWKELDVDCVLECTGFYTSKEKSMAHIEAGAKKVVISAPAGNDIKTIVYNTNHETLTKDDQIISIFRTTTRSSYGLITSAGRLIVAHVVELPVVSADGPLHVTGGVHAEELIGTTENTDPIRGERVIAAIAMPSADDSGDNAVEPTPLALGTRNGVVKRWNRESPTTMDSWSVIDLKDDDEVLAAAEARDEDRLVFVSTDSSLLTFEAKNVRPQGRTAGGMAGIRLAEGCSAAAFAVVPASKVAWNYEEGENGLFSASGAVVLTVAGDSEALPGTENGSAKVTPLEMYPTKGRGTGGVRSQRFLKGQDTLVLAFVGAYPVHASTQGGAGVELPKPDMRRDGSGTELSAPIAIIG